MNLGLEAFDYPAGRVPADVVLEHYRPGQSRSTAAKALRSIAALASDGEIEASRFPWHQLRYEHTAKLRSAMIERWTPRGVNLRLSLLRAVIRAAWRLEYMTGDEKERALDVANVPLGGELRGRCLDRAELASLFDACSRDGSPAGARDAALLGLLYGAGLRAAEVARLDLDCWRRQTEELLVLGKGGKVRLAWTLGELGQALDDWIALRGSDPGPLFCPVNRGGELVLRRLAPQAARWICLKRADEAGLEHFSPHDLRRSFVSHLLEDGVDLAVVRDLAGHAELSTTILYDRRGSDSRRLAAGRLSLPFTSRRRARPGRARTSS